jgi:thiol-disulfide isomerase/thioredoxin
MDQITNTSSNLKDKFMGIFTWTNIIIIFLVGLFIGITVSYYNKHISKTDDNYKANKELIKGGSKSNTTAELLLFYADWCPNCTTAKPEWTAIKEQYEGTTVNGYKLLFTEIDCSNINADLEKIMDKYNIEGYPTIKLIKDNYVVEYDAKVTQKTLDKFINTILSDS